MKKSQQMLRFFHILVRDFAAGTRYHSGNHHAFRQICPGLVPNISVFSVLIGVYWEKMTKFAAIINDHLHGLVR